MCHVIFYLGFLGEGNVSPKASRFDELVGKGADCS